MGVTGEPSPDNSAKHNDSDPVPRILGESRLPGDLFVAGPVTKYDRGEPYHVLVLPAKLDSLIVPTLLCLMTCTHDSTDS